MNQIIYLKQLIMLPGIYNSRPNSVRGMDLTENMIKADLHNANPESTFTMGET